jgi:hypothetical protein
MSWDDRDELEGFKRNIDLRAYAATHGYFLDPKEAWTGSAGMRHDNGDKIVITRDTDGHYVYYSFRDPDDNGTIVDFIQRRKRLNLGEVRKKLRRWTGQSRPSIPVFDELVKTPRDRQRVIAEYSRMQDARRHPYLEKERCIPVELLCSPRFLGRIRIDDRWGNAVFPHFDEEGLCGYEIRNRAFKGFAAGGSKGLWRSHEQVDDNRLVICESAIDCLSHAALFVNPRARYASIGGQVNGSQPDLIKAAIASMPLNAEIVAAMDADAPGRDLAAMVRSAFDAVGREDLAFRDHVPGGFKDWNEQLCSTQTLEGRL